VKDLAGTISAYIKSACSTIPGIETMHMLQKNQAGRMTPFEQMEFIHRIMNVG